MELWLVALESSPHKEQDGENGRVCGYLYEMKRVRPKITSCIGKGERVQLCQTSMHAHVNELKIDMWHY